MQQALSIWLPRLPIELIRRRDRRSPGSPDPAPPLLVIREQHRRQIVVHACARAEHLGVRPGLPASEARVLIDGPVRTETLAPERDAAALRSLAFWAQRLSPIVAADPPDGLLLDISGCAHLFGDAEGLLAAAVRGLRRLGFTARAAAAPTFGAAWALARFGGPTPCVVPEGGVRGALEPLPVRALRLSEETVNALREVGVERAGELLDLPRAALPARFGDELLLRIDQALGHAMETVEAIRRPGPIEVSRAFDGPTTQWEAVELATQGLIERACARLLEHESGTRRLRIELARPHLPAERLKVSTSEPTRDPRHLWALVRPRLERANLGEGVDAITVHAGQTARILHEQTEHWREESPRRERRRAMGALVDAMNNRFGGVYTAQLRESHVPERAAALSPTASLECADTHTPATGDRPPALLDRPEEIRVIALSPDGPVLSVRWRGADHRAIGCVGPERISPEWWHGERATRSYSKVQLESGLWLWVFRRETGHATARWFVHGVWS